MKAAAARLGQALLLLAVLAIMGAVLTLQDARAVEYDEATRTIKLSAEEAAECAEGKGCLVITNAAYAQAARALQLMYQAAPVIEKLGLELAAAKAKLASCTPDARPTGLSWWP